MSEFEKARQEMETAALATERERTSREEKERISALASQRQKQKGGEFRQFLESRRQFVVANAPSLLETINKELFFGRGTVYPWEQKANKHTLAFEYSGDPDDGSGGSVEHISHYSQVRLEIPSLGSIKIILPILEGYSTHKRTGTIMDSLFGPFYEEVVGEEIPFIGYKKAKECVYVVYTNAKSLASKDRFCLMEKYVDCLMLDQPEEELLSKLKADSIRKAVDLHKLNPLARFPQE